MGGVHEDPKILEKLPQGGVEKMRANPPPPHTHIWVLYTEPLALPLQCGMPSVGFLVLLWAAGEAGGGAGGGHVRRGSGTWGLK